MVFDFEKDLSNNVYDFLKIVTDCAIKNNINIYFVGGVVRDKLLNKKIKDIDLIVEGDAIEFSKKLPCEIKIKSVHKDFSTVKVDFLNQHFDIASTRSEIYSASAALPIVKNVGISIKKDVIRRDFSVNSLYLKLGLKNDKLTFKLIDYVGGVQDINDKLLKVLHKNSYIDDPTRIIRGVNFKYRFGFDFSIADKKLIKNYLDDIDLKLASIDRIKSVFIKTLNDENSSEIFKDIIDNKYYKIIGTKSLNVNFKKAEETIDDFKLTKLEKAKFYFKILENKQVLKSAFKNKLEIYKTFLKKDKVNLAYYYYKTNDKNIVLFNKIKNIKLHITGDDLLKMNYKQGKIFSEIFDNLLLYKIENNIESVSTKDEINRVRKNFPNE